jgi:AraC family transcriptional regulator
MVIEPRIETLSPRILVGMRMAMSMVTDRTSELWRSFRPRMGAVPGRVSDGSVALRSYRAATDVFDPEAVFERWAGVEVSGHEDVPEGLEIYRISGGLYAVFQHRGPARDLRPFRFFFQEWLPESTFDVDLRPHFELLPASYDPWSPAATEECFIPVRKTA